MHITRLELESIKSYERADFTFERGTTAIVGPNGVGKTTILEAVAWTLFDVLDYSKDDFVRRGSKRGSVRVTFQSDIDERLYTVYRDTGTGYFVYDPELRLKVQQGKADVRKFLEQHLGVEPGTDVKSLFRSAIGVPQGLLTSDFLRSPSERKAAFDRLLKVEEYRESADRLRDTLHLIDKRTAESRVRISSAEAQLSRYDAIVADHRHESTRVEELNTEHRDAQEAFDAYTRDVEQLDKLDRRVAETQTVVDRLEVAHSAAERRLGDVRNELLVAEKAAERLRSTEESHRIYLMAEENLRSLEKERTERDRLRNSAAKLAQKIAAAEVKVRSTSDDLERALKAAEMLTAVEKDVPMQEKLEHEREVLRENLTLARAAREEIGRLDTELKSLQKQYSETRRRVRAAEVLKGAAERVTKLELERHDLEIRMSETERSLTSRGHLVKQQRDQSREIERLRKSVAAIEREAQELEKHAVAAAGVPSLEVRERELVQQAASVRAAIERDERIRQETKGGVCPILGDRCTSFSEGQTFETYFGAQLKKNNEQLSVAELEIEAVARSLTEAREAERNLTRVEATRARLARESDLLRDREGALARLDLELAALPRATEELRAQMQAELKGFNESLIAAHADALRYGELESLRARLLEIEDEGKAKKSQRDRAVEVASADTALEKAIETIDEQLKELDDPRGRVAILRKDAVREKELRSKAEAAREAITTLQKENTGIEESSKRFETLDARWLEATAKRDASAADHHEYLQSAALAKMLPEREREAKAAEEAAAAAQRELEIARLQNLDAKKDYDPENHRVKRTSAALAGQRTASLSARLEAAKEKEADLRERIAQLDEVRESVREEYRAKDRLEKVFETTDFIRDTLKKAGPLVTESYLFNISIEANQLFREITGEGGRAIRWTKDYEIVLEQDGYELSFVNLSGGEQMVAALSVRLALLKQLSDIRIAFFDEPTINMDEERRSRLALQLGQVHNLDQLFVISHDDTFEESVDHVLAIARTTEEVA